MRPTSAKFQKYEIVLGTKKKMPGCSGRYSPIMARAIFTWKPSENGFQEALNFFLEKRKEVLRHDLTAAFLSPKKIQYGALSELDYHLRLLNQNAIARLKGLDSKKFYTPVIDHVNYRKLYRYLVQKDFYKRWSPQTDRKLKLKHPPLLITRTKGSSFRLYHAWSSDIPAILRHLGQLWNQALLAGTPQEALVAIARFEWWFFNANPTGRSAAALGDCLSLVLQKKQRIPLRKKFIRLDFYALGREQEEYTQWRIKNLRSKA